MWLALDRGNSRIKAGAFSSDGKLMHSLVADQPGDAMIHHWLSEYDVQHLISSTTGQYGWDVSRLPVSGKIIELHHDSNLPVRLIYKTPHTLGRDRIAGACGALALYPGRHCLIIDAGTCITTDMVLAGGIFIGGNIAPGISMRLQSMHDHTARLPLVEPAFPILPMGDTTMHALQNGALLGAIMEIEGIIFRMRQAYGDLSVVITGGDAGMLAGRLEYQIFVEPELVLHGLYKILSLNV